jgi:hypothetical protein
LVLLGIALAAFGCVSDQESSDLLLICWDNNFENQEERYPVYAGDLEVLTPDGGCDSFVEFRWGRAPLTVNLLSQYDRPRQEDVEATRGAIERANASVGGELFVQDDQDEEADLFVAWSDEHESGFGHSANRCGVLQGVGYIQRQGGQEASELELLHQLGHLAGLAHDRGQPDSVMDEESLRAGTATSFSADDARELYDTNIQPNR